MKKSVLITTIFLLALFKMSAQVPSEQAAKQQYTFNLEQAIAHALANNRTAVNAGRDIEIAKKKKWETTAAGLPQISAGVDYLYNIKIQKTIIPADAFPSTDPTAPPPDPDDYFVTEFGTKQNMSARATLSQIIFDGSYVVALQASKTYLQYYQNYKVKADNEVRQMVITSYGNVLLAEESITILERNKSVLEKTLNDTQETFKSGLIEEENVEQLQITLGSVNSSLNNAKRIKDISYKMLKVTLGIEIEDDLTLTEKLDKLTATNLDLAMTQSEFNITNNIDYKIGQNFSEQRRLEHKLSRSKALPSLGASLNYGTVSFADKQFTFFDSKQRWFDFSNIGVGLTIPIFSSGARSARTQQAKIAYDQAKTQLTETEQRLKLQYQTSKSEYDFSIEEFATAKSNLNLAERIERKQQTKFTEGLSTSFEFSEAQRQLYAAQQNYLQSMVNVINRRAALDKIINGI